MKKLLIKNVQMIYEGKPFYGDIYIKNGRIEQIAENINLRSDSKYREINAHGLHILPGLIDDQVHFREPGLTHKATIASESRAAIAGGITSFIEQPNTKPPATTIDLLNEKLAIASKTSYANYGFNLGATNDNLEELQHAVDDYSPLFAGVKIFMGSSTGNMLVDKRETLEGIFKLNKLAITHCEDEETILRNTQRYKDIYGDAIPIHLHPVIRSEEACFKSSSFAVELAKQLGTRLHVYHISTEEELALFSNTLPLVDKLITAEACIHHLWFDSRDYEIYGSHIKWNPAVKDERHKLALRKAVVDDVLDVIATDHAPHTFEEKTLPYTSCPSGAPLVQHALHAAIKMFGKDKLPFLIQKMCHNPAILFGIQERGYIREGYYADLVLVDLNATPWIVEKPNILYKCGWSPLEGEEFKTRVVMTIINGNIAYDDRIQHPQGYGDFAGQTFGQQIVFTR